MYLCPHLTHHLIWTFPRHLTIVCDVEVCLVNAARMELVVISRKDIANLVSLFHIPFKIWRDEKEFRAELLCNMPRHAASHAPLSGHIVTRRNNGPTDAH